MLYRYARGARSSIDRKARLNRRYVFKVRNWRTKRTTSGVFDRRASGVGPVGGIGDERTGLFDGPTEEGRDFAPRIHGPRCRPRRIDGGDLEHVGERRRLRRGNAEEGRHVALGSRRRQHDRQHRHRQLHRFRDDRCRPRPVQRHRRMGRGRQAEAGPGVELGAEERRQGLGLQPSQGRQVLEWQGIHRRRRHLFAQLPSRRQQVGRQAGAVGGHRRQEARQVSDPDFACRGRRGPALQPDRLSHSDGARRLQGLGQSGRHRRLPAREVRPRRTDRAEAEPGLLERGQRPSRRGGNHRDHRFHRALQCAEVRADRHHQPRRSQGGRPARKIWL